jgi:hypothetical protein
MTCDHRELVTPLLQLAAKWRSEAASIRRHPSRTLGSNLAAEDPTSAMVRDRLANELEAIVRQERHDHETHHGRDNGKGH